MKQLFSLTLVALALLPCIRFAYAAQSPISDQKVESSSGEQVKVIDHWISQAETLLLIRPDSAFVYADRALTGSISIRYQEAAGRSHQLIGEVFFHRGVFLQSLEHLL